MPIQTDRQTLTLLTLVYQGEWWVNKEAKEVDSVGLGKNVHLQNTDMFCTALLGRNSVKQPDKDSWTGRWTVKL